MKKKIGQLIEERVKAQNLNVVDFAKQIDTERSNVYDIFKRESIDTGLLKKIGQVLHYDFFQDLLEPETVKEIVLRHSLTNRVYVELTLTEEEIKNLGLEDKVITQLTNT
jgi:hypothetical protein